MTLFNPLSGAFGLDMGDHSFKLVQCKRARGKTEQYALTAWNATAIPPGVMDDGEIVNPDAAAKLIAMTVCNAHGCLNGKAVIASLPESKTFVKVITVAAGLNEEQVRQAVVKEIEDNVPLPADDLYFDWQYAAERESEPLAADNGNAADQQNERQVIYGAVSKKIADSYTDVLERAGLVPISLDIEATAIARALIAKDDLATSAIGLLDIGAERSSLVISEHGCVQISLSIPISGNEITEKISEGLAVTPDDAELLKKECGLDATRCGDNMWNILLPLIDDMTEKIRNALRFYKVGLPEGQKIDHILLCGGGARFKEIDTVLSRRLAIKVRRGNPFVNLAQSIPAKFPVDDALSYTVAIGLGMRATDEIARHRRAL